MDWLKIPDWSAFFLPDVPLLEIITRGSVMYLTMFILLRVVLKRQTGSVGLTDMLVIVLLADASQNGMAGDYQSLPDGIALVCTLIFWNYALEWLAFHWPWFDKIISPPPLTLVRHGKLIYRNMRRELITENDIMAQLRQQGVDELRKVKRACMEGDGKISVVTYGNA